MTRHSSAGSLSHVVLTVALCLAGVSGTQAQTWTLKGPGPANGGQAEGITNSPIGGALETVLAHPTNANILWVGSVNGGIFRTNDATAAVPTWTAQTDAQTSLSISALERDTTDGTHNTLVAAIGRTSSYGSLGGAFQGILRTTNGGTTWTNPGSAGIGDKDIRGVAARGTTILAAIAGGAACGDLGIFRSTDTGANFTQISTGAGTGLPCGDSLDLASDPTDGTRFFAPATRTGGATDGLYVTANTGANWAQVGSGSIMDVALQTSPREVQVAVGNGGGASANIFVAVCQAGELSGLFYSGDAGANWANLDLPMTTEAVGPTVYGIHPGGQCGTHLSLVADPTDDSVVYIGGDRQPANNESDDTIDPQFPNSIGASTYGGRLFRVDADLAPDAQATPITNCDGDPGPLPPGCGGTQRTANDTAPHADSREMVFDANGDLIQTDDGGVYRHTDPSGTTGNWFSVVGDLAAVEQHDVAYDTVSDILISGNQDNGTTNQTTPASAVWTTVYGGDGGDVVVAQDRPVAGQSTRYFSFQNLGGLVRAWYDASNTLKGFAFPTLTPMGTDPAVDPQFKTPLKVNDHDPTRLIVGGANGIYESLDELDTVTQLETWVVPSFRGGSPIAYGRPGNAELLYFGEFGYVNFRIGPPGTALSFYALAGDVTGVTIDPDSDVQAFATNTTSVRRTEDAGASWTNVTGDLFTLPNNPGQINFVEYINIGGDRLVVAADRGVYSATEASGFSTWTPYGTGLPNAVVFELDYNAADNVLAAGTMGRGTWLLTPSAGSCIPIESYSGTTLNTPQTYYASDTINLGPNLIIDANGINMVAPKIIIEGPTTIRNVFSAGAGPCP